MNETVMGSEPTDRWETQPFRIVIEGIAPDHWFPELLDAVRRVTPVDGGFTLSVGTLAIRADGCE